MSEPKPILISGGGLCGLLVAQALTTHNIPFIVYERDASFEQRAQGYRLRMSTEGLAAIEKILPPDDWKTFRAGVATTRGGGFQRVDPLTGEKKKLDGGAPSPQVSVSAGGSIVVGLGPSGEVYGLARGYLRQSLMKGIKDKIHYGKAVTSYTSTPTGVTAHFQDGTSSPEGSLLIGADGVQSFIAKQLSEGKVRVYDTGARMIHGQSPTTAFKGLGEGVFVIDDEKQGVKLITNVRPGDMDDPNINFGWTMAGLPGVIDAPGNRFNVVGQVAADLAKELTKHWSDKIRPIFEEQIVAEAGFWKMTTSSPEGVPEWTNDPRVTIVGDAAHSMTPAGGNGANTALITASILGTTIREAGGWKEDVTEKYEKEMRVLASRNVKASFETASRMFGIKELKDNVSTFSSPTAG